MMEAASMPDSAAPLRAVPVPDAVLLLRMVEGTRYAHCHDDQAFCAYRVWLLVFTHLCRRAAA